MSVVICDAYHLPGLSDDDLHDTYEFLSTISPQKHNEETQPHLGEDYRKWVYAMDVTFMEIVRRLNCGQQQIIA